MLVKVIENIKAIPVDTNASPLSKDPANITILQQLISGKMPSLSISFAQEMPDWVIAKFFDQEAERQRLLVHDYQQTEMRNLRSMANTKLLIA